MKKILISLLLLFFIQLSAFAEDKPQAMIVLDASGSMWGQIDGKAKITIAKKALNKVVSDWDENVHLGLMAYGHRKKGDCNDIQTLTSIGKLNKKSMLSQVKKISPKGKTPISRSLKKAAEDLRYTEEKATIILISDGMETCDADPCGTAKALESKGIDFVAHVIGFDVDKKTDAQLKCIAESTGGEYFSAKNASSLNLAMGTIAEKVQKAEPKPPVIKKLKKNIQITASEKEGGKWVKAYHYIHKVVDGEVVKIGVKGSYSRKGKAYLEQLPEGQYVLKSTYNHYKVETPVEVKASELSKVHIVMGQTGKAEITASEKEGGKWVKAYHYLYKVVDGEVQKSHLNSSYSRKDKSYLHQLPIGQYLIKSTYNKLKQETPFEIKSGEVTKIQVVMGQTGKVEITASEKEGGKWVKAYHYLHKVIDGEVGPYVEACYSEKQKGCMKKVPVGKYVLRSTFNAFKKDTPFIVEAGKASKVHVTFAQFFVESKCSDMSATINHEIYASNGRMVYSKQGKCSDKLKVPLDNGKYTIESKVGSDVKETKFTLGAGHPDHIIIDMSKTDEEDSHQALIEADKAAAKAIAPVEKAIEEVAQATPEVTIEKVESKTVSIPQKDLIQAYKQVISTSLPELVKVKNCYQQAEDITQAKKCEDMEEAALKQAQASMQKSLGITDNTNNLIKHEEWTDDIKKETLNKAEKEINNMKISIICLDKGAALSQLDNCISKGGEL